MILFKSMKIYLRLRSSGIFILICLFVLMAGHDASAQYFGKNKPRYQSFDFQVQKSEHFELYNYLKNPSYRNEILRWSEDWYTVHKALFNDTLVRVNPIVLYNNHPEFQQTNAIMSSVDVGTGGVTEAFKNRVIMPLALTKQQTHHVLGHELVHAFQYNLIINQDSTSLNNMGNIPLWMIEGMAEYLSIGRHDPFTAMWMRDAVANDDIPRLRDLSSGRYFPYRYGQAFWAFVSGHFSDSHIRPLFQATAIYGLDNALKTVLGVTEKEFDVLWSESLKSHYGPLIAGKPKLPGKELISEKAGGESNIAPVISPDGKYIAFWSDKNVISYDMYLADAKSEKIMHRLTRSLTQSQHDYLNFLESGGAWSPNSKEIVFVAVDKGRHILVRKDAASGKTLQQYRPKQTSAIYSPTWSQDGRFIVYVGMEDGKTNLYRMSVNTGNSIRLTNDDFAQIQPSWSLGGQYIVFVTDYLSRVKYGPEYGKWKFNLAILNLETEEIEQLDILPSSNCFNPIFTDGDEIWFLSDYGGYKNLFSYNTGTKELLQRTDAITGISGITVYSPAISYSHKSDEVVYNIFNKRQYSVFSAKRDSFEKIEVDPASTDKEAGVLPPLKTAAQDIVNANLNLLNRTGSGEKTYPRTKFRPRFKMDYITGNVGAGVGTGSLGMGSAMAGGIMAIFSDITGDHQIFGTAALNGEVYDVGLAMQYLNRKHRIQWGVSVSHIPSVIGGSRLERNASFLVGGVQMQGDILRTDILRMFRDQIGIFAQYPLSVALRIEAGAGATYQYFRADRYTQYFSGIYGYVGSTREKIPPENSIFGNYRFDRGLIYNASVAFVGDNSFMGPTGPLAGWRFRLGADQFFGMYKYYSLTADLRRYLFLKPVTIAGRLLHYGQMGADANLMYPLYIGQLGLVRGLNFSDVDFYNDFDIDIRRLLGSKLFMASLEVRLPFTGIDRLALLPVRWLYSDFVIFADAGTAFYEYKHLSFDDDNPFQPVLATTAGLALRVNLMGLIVEPYYAWFIHGKAKGAFGLSLLIPGF